MGIFHSTNTRFTYEEEEEEEEEVDDSAVYPNLHSRGYRSYGEYSLPVLSFTSIYNATKGLLQKVKNIIVAVMSDEERKIKHYSSRHRILLVGEGDFSFSACLAVAFGDATNIIATSLNTEAFLKKHYGKAMSNIAELRRRGGQVLHGVDATRMATRHEFQCRKFHRIIYNFPHAGFLGREDNPEVMMRHRNLVRGFLQNASSMLHIVGEIHVRHKTGAPFDSWKIEDMASECSLVCFAQDQFNIKDYPGYNNKRGSGSRADEPFPLGASKTYRFRLCPAAVNNLIMSNAHLLPQTFLPRAGVQQQIANSSFSFSYVSESSSSCAEPAPLEK